MAVHGMKGTGDGRDEHVTFNARLPKRVKLTIQRAADLRGQSLSEFVVGSAYDRALEAISTDNVVQLSARDSAAFAAALVQPPAPDARVLAHFLRAHRKAVR